MFRELKSIVLQTVFDLKMSAVFSLYVIAVFLTLTLTAPLKAQREDVPKFEIGGQFSVLSRNKPTPLVSSPTAFSDDFFRETRIGFGGRFTYNVTNNIALEAEGNFFPKSDKPRDLSVPGGTIFQAQFGVKVGKRFSKFGVFGKVRPGFVRFTEASQQTGTRTITFNNQQYAVGEFQIGKESYFSTDIGGVVEFYVSRRIVTRVDLGDTIIHYGVYRRASFVLSQPFVERRPETKHNFQFSAGIGFRF